MALRTISLIFSLAFKFLLSPFLLWAKEERLLLQISFIFNYLYVCVCMWVCTPECSCPQRPEEGIRNPGTGVTGHCESPDTGAASCTWVSGSRKVSQAMSHPFGRDSMKNVYFFSLDGWGGSDLRIWSAVYHPRHSTFRGRDSGSRHICLAVTKLLRQSLIAAGGVCKLV